MADRLAMNHEELLREKNLCLIAENWTEKWRKREKDIYLKRPSLVIMIWSSDHKTDQKQFVHKQIHVPIWYMFVLLPNLLLLIVIFPPWLMSLWLNQIWFQSQSIFSHSSTKGTSIDLTGRAKVCEFGLSLTCFGGQFSV